jgi:hypothetical protein
MLLPKLENNFEAGFSRAKVYGVFTSQLPLKKSVSPTLEKPDLKSLSDSRKKIPWQKPTPPYNFSLGPTGV